MEQLTPEEVRVLGCLVEKEHTTPDYYPLTLNALTNACNQKSNRDPVVQYDDRTVIRAIDGLREKKLCLLVSTAGGRVPKYRHRLDEVLQLRPGEVAVLCVLMLRGPETVGEIRSHAQRLYEFDELSQVETVLDDLNARLNVPLVAELPRMPGQKENRYAHLLAGEPDIAAETIQPAVEPARAAVETENRRLEALEAEVQALKTQLAELHQTFESFRRQFE